MQISRSVMAVCGAVIATALIGFTNPKAVHAVTAALVQVTNTATNPVVTQRATEQSGQIIHLRCSNQVTGPYGGGGCAQVSGGTVSSTMYVVPANQSLVITSVDIFPTQIYISTNCTVIHDDGLYVSQGGSAYYAQTWAVNNISVHYAYSSGIVIATGSSVTGSSAYFNNPSPGSCYSPADYNDQFDLYGYLTVA